MLTAFTVITTITWEVQQASVTDQSTQRMWGWDQMHVCQSGPQGAVLVPVESLGDSAFVCMSFVVSSSMARLSLHLCGLSSRFFGENPLTLISKYLCCSVVLNYPT